MHSIDYSKRIYCLITGGSRGIGRTIAIELARRSTNKLTLVLIARSESDLLETKNTILNVNENATIKTIALDLSNATTAQYEQTLNSTLIPSEFDSALIFHNVGFIGSIKKAVDLVDPTVWQNYFNLNVVSVTTLNAIFLKKVLNVIEHIFIINITSLVGRKPFKYLSMYGSGKAARDLYFKVVAEEQNNVVVLNYSPGMVQTNMASDLIANIKEFTDSAIFVAAQDKSNILEAGQTVSKMFTVLERADFKSGDIIDYYDVQ